MICIKCNIQYEKGKKFCMLCGSPLSEVEGLQESELDGQAISTEKDVILLCDVCNVTYRKIL